MPAISTRMHGIIDYGAAGLSAALSRSDGVSTTTRAVLAASAAFHTTYSLLTDYEAGLRPRIGMRTHLALDTLGGLALCAAGIGMTREPAASRALMLAAGVSELVLVALSDRQVVHGPGRSASLLGRMLGREGGSGVSYPPLDVPKLVANNIWIVDSAMPGLVGRVVGVRMTVIRLRNGDLLIHSPTRHSAGLQRALTRLGRIRHFVAPNLAHLTFLSEWQRACPGATTWAAPKVSMRGAARRGELRVDQELGQAAPATWGDDVGLVMVPGAAGFREAALFHKPSRTLVLTDLVLNLEAGKVPLLLRPLLGWAGSLTPDGMPPPHVRAIMKLGGRDMTRAARQLLALRPERVIFAHGRWFDHDGTSRLRTSLQWALPPGADSAIVPVLQSPALIELGRALLDRLRSAA